MSGCHLENRFNTSFYTRISCSPTFASHACIAKCRGILQYGRCSLRDFHGGGLGQSVVSVNEMISGRLWSHQGSGFYRPAIEAVSDNNNDNNDK